MENSDEARLKVKRRRKALKSIHIFQQESVAPAMVTTLPFTPPRR
ncbi:MAG: hypothetical protein ACI8S7_001179, partial [Candidatus Krumholzibacteriia bacterium]